MLEKNGAITDETPSDVSPQTSQPRSSGIGKAADDQQPNPSSRTSHPATRAADAVASSSTPRTR